MKPAKILAVLLMALLPLGAVAPLATAQIPQDQEDGPSTRRDRAGGPDGTRAGRPGGFGILGGGKAQNAGPCPLLGVLYDSGRLVEFAAPEERFANVAFTGELRGVRGLCRYTGSKPIEMDLQIEMAFGKGPAASGSSKTYRYWVAVTRSNLAPIEKKYFDITVNFPRNADRMAGTEKIDKIVIPRANDTISGANFEILVGFELTPEQLAFNRSGKRFRVDVAQQQQQQKPAQPDGK